MIEEPAQLTVNKARNRPTAAQIAAFQGVQTSFVADALGGDGALDPAIRPLGEGRDIRCVAAGPALTADAGPADILATYAALHFLSPGDILVVAFGGHQRCAAVGDRVMGMVRNNEAAGFVTDGPVRDYAGIVDVGLPVWCTGLNPASPFSNGPGTVGLPISIGGRQVATGDMICGDRDGVVVVPFDQIDTVIARLAEIHKLEAKLDAEVANGRRHADKVARLIEDGKINYVG
ncbi:RraA family protein [Acuticoccus sp. MNP-M23]|uniref:RraA family protein n=1 Tax=Acuticoccus sp. MNP-M23 TaxID=3072793 RepID=UPI0028159214|nr:RraA family protein [Acuticoccus sp. MNP-M23]WMS44815.1 RraA family protein [Acuticoccus sp. MNP-M23]